MKVEGGRLKGEGTGSALLFIVSLAASCLLITNVVIAADKWEGVDKSVVEKYAADHGRQPREPLINTDQGDLLLFVFLVAGTAGGFAAGYYWRVLTEKKRSDPRKDKSGGRG